MWCIRKIEKFISDNKWTLCLLLSLLLYAGNAFAVFESLKMAGNNIFEGLKTIIYPAATIGIACVCIAGMFGNFNWKWLVAILIGIFVISFAYETASLAGADIAGGS